MTKLSEHFSYAEMTTSETAVRRGLENTPSETELEELKKTCSLILEPLRAKIGPIKILSGYRSPKLNRLIGGSAKSQHCQGRAADILPLRMGLVQAYTTLVDSEIAFDQAIFEFKRWIHVSYSPTPRKQSLVAIKENGRTVYATLDHYGRENL